MILEGIQIVSNWIGFTDLHSAGSVNAQIDALPRVVGDDTPNHILGVYDETRDDIVALRQEPPVFPALYVMLDQPWEMEGEVGTIIRRATDVPIVIRLLLNEYGPARARRESHYVMEAVVSSMYELLKNENAASRTLNGICLETVSTMSYLTITEKVGESTVTGAIVAMCNLRDTRPGG